MMFRFYLKLALKNLVRHKRRTLLTALAIAVGIFYFIILDSLLVGIDRDAVNNLIDFETGHIQVAAQLEKDEELTDLNNLLTNETELVSQLEQVTGVTAVAPRLLFVGALGNGQDELPITGLGVNPQKDQQVFRIAKYLQEGSWLQKNSKEVVVGSNIAKLLELKVGDLVSLRTKTKQKSFQALDLQIRGIVATPHPDINQSQIFLPLKVAQEALGAPGEISVVIIRTQETAINEVQQAISQQDLTAFTTKAKTETWREVAADYLAYMESERSFDTLFLFLVMIISVIGIINSILLSSLERVREIGIFKAMGMLDKEIVRVFIYEGVGLGLLGGLIGIILGVFTNVYFVTVGLDLLKMYGDLDVGIPLAGKMYGAWNWPVILGTLIASMIIALVASYYPAKKAAALDPIEGLRRIK